MMIHFYYCINVYCYVLTVVHTALLITDECTVINFFIPLLINYLEKNRCFTLFNEQAYKPQAYLARDR